MPCSQSCGTGFQERSRSCTQPVPKPGGKACHGDLRESRECNTHSCPGKNNFVKFFVIGHFLVPLFQNESKCETI